MTKSKPGLYLSGAIEASKDPNSWREKLYKALYRKYKVIIPVAKTKCPFDKQDPEFAEWIMTKFILPDMIDVTTSRYFFAKIDKAVFKGAGTISEITTAAWMGKDMIILLDKIKLSDIPEWTVGCFANATFVDSIDEAIEVYKEKAKERIMKEKEQEE